MRFKTISIGVMLLLLLGWGAQAQSEDTLRVLFVGNSYTYFWNLPQTVSAMAATKDRVIVARKSTSGGVTWKQHWEGDRGLESRSMITQNDWDVVVLQNHSMSTINAYDDFMEYGGRFVDLVKSQGVKPVLYMTWARAYNPLMQATISKAYETLGDTKDVDVVPVGEIWERSRELRPDLNLYDPDGSHPSTSGTYLTACAFFSYLTRMPASGLPKRISNVDKNGEDMYYAIMSQQDATFLQQLVDNYLADK